MIVNHQLIKNLVIKQSEENKESFILKLNILDGQISYENAGNPL